jgi:hypothetical protein
MENARLRKPAPTSVQCNTWQAQPRICDRASGRAAHSRLQNRTARSIGTPRRSWLPTATASRAKFGAFSAPPNILCTAGRRVLTLVTNSGIRDCVIMDKTSGRAPTALHPTPEGSRRE